MALRLILADDHALFRQGLKSLLALDASLSVVAEVERVADLPAVLDSTPCDVLLLDLQMDRSALGEIDVLARRARVVVVTASEQPADALAAIRAGASAVVFKRFAIETLREAIDAAHGGLVWLPPAIQAELRARAFQPSPERLSAREHEIVELVALGLRNAEIGRRLAISEATVKTHLNNVFHKLGVRDRVELVRHAIRDGLVRIDERRS
ncbi:MAG: response regulator transcription factor [Thermodesulfobacteriota bacterium]